MTCILLELQDRSKSLAVKMREAYLELNIMNDLFLDETPPPELARSPSSSASSKLTDALANAGRRGR